MRARSLNAAAERKRDSVRVHELWVQIGGWLSGRERERSGMEWGAIVDTLLGSIYMRRPQTFPFGVFAPLPFVLCF